jgi:hypothetical protein
METQGHAQSGDAPEDIPTVGTKLLAPECSAVAEQLESSIAQYRALGFPAETRGPLVPALCRLREIATRGTYGPTVSELRTAASALMIANDFASILTCLPQALNGPPPDELVRMFDGTLDLSEYRGAHDLRAQFAFAAMLGRGYFSPRLVPAQAQKKTPDFIVTVGKTRCGVEVKRPANATRMMKKIDEAAAQLRDVGLPGFVVLDLSRMHNAYSASTDAMTLTPSLRAVLRASFFSHTVDVIRHCEVQNRNPVKRDKYTYVIGVAFFVRIAHWLRSDQSAPALLQLHSEGPILWSSAERGLIGEAFVFTKRVGQLLGVGTSRVRFSVGKDGEPIAEVRLGL